MYDPAFTKRELHRRLRKSDFKRYPDLYVPDRLSQVLDEAYAKSLTGFVGPLNTISNSMNGKPVYNFKTLADDLLVRKANSNIKALTKARQNDRDGIVYNLIRLLEEQPRYRVYRLDIKSFYESVDTDLVVEKFEKDLAVSRETIRVVKTFLQQLHSQGVVGLPRGMHISSTLSEYAMRDFDNFVKKRAEVYFYARFVDDMVIITDGLESEKEFLKILKKMLFGGLTFNKQKCIVHSILAAKKKSGDPSHSIDVEFDFLGYTFNIKHPSNTPKDSKFKREISIDISSNKIKKIKTRITKAFLSYDKSSDFNLLMDRIKLLTGNYTVLDSKKPIRRKTGIYFSYKHVTANKAVALYELDAYLKKIVLSGEGKVSSSVSTKLSEQQKRSLLKQTFINGFRERVFHHFQPVRLHQIMSCWAYG